MPIYDDLAKKYSDKTFVSHMNGIAQELNIGSLQERVDKNQQARLWSAFVRYTGLQTKAEGTHGGKDIAFAQFADSAWQIYTSH
jgi:hypothetical protein